jgi:hypothetical protein
VNKRTEELLDTSAAVLICMGVFGAGIWRGAQPLPTAKKEAEPAACVDEEPLDRVARLAGRSELPEPLEPSSVGEVLEQQSLMSDQLEGWSAAAPERLPIPTYAPAIMALGVVLFAMGLATVWYVCVVGSIVFAIAAWRWTGELQGE